MTNLILAKERKVEQDFQRLGISGHDDQRGDTTVEGLGGCKEETGSGQKSAACNVIEMERNRKSGLIE
jgi:hypothetical protein